MFYDDKTKGVLSVGRMLFIPEVDDEEDIVLKASFLVAGDLKCSSKVSALFDVVVLGDIECADLDVKGKLVCLGNCTVENGVDVQNEIWVNDLRASTIICHDRIVAMGIDADRVTADGNVVVGKTLAIEDRAETLQRIICGETAYGAGRLVASTIITAEPLDMDDGEEALENPFVFHPKGSGVSLFDDLQEYVVKNDFDGFVNALLLASDAGNSQKYKRALRIFRIMDDAYPDKLAEFRDVSLVLWLIEMQRSEYFAIWPQIPKWLSAVSGHFENLIHGIETTESMPKPANRLEVGYVVDHSSYGRGVVECIDSNHAGKYAHVLFDDYGKKVFPIPNSLKFFSILSEKQGLTSEDIKNSIECNIKNYDEWIEALTILNANKNALSDDLYDAIYDRLLSHIGLKIKFVKDRMKEKGWE